MTKKKKIKKSAAHPRAMFRAVSALAILALLILITETRRPEPHAETRLETRSAAPVVAKRKRPTTPRPVKPSTIARVTGITDGDSIEVLWNGKTQKIQLAEIDCPKRGKASGTRAKKALSRLLHGKSVRLAVTGRDRYGVKVARISVAGKDLNKEMIRSGCSRKTKKVAANR